MIISASRRTDIPRFHVEWFLDRIDAGSVEIVNPFNARQVRTVSLAPADVDCLVFWTRDPRPLLPHLADLDARGYRYYFMITLTGYPPELEPRASPVAEIVDVFFRLHEMIGSARTIWRYDPLFLSNVTDARFHARNFGALARALSGTTERVVLSAYDEYRRSKGRVAALSGRGIEARPAHDEDGRLRPEARDLLGELASIARGEGLEARSCAEKDDLGGLGIEANACADGELIQRLWGLRIDGKKDRSQRPACRCAASVDIGTYGTCPAGCVYCYAT